VARTDAAQAVMATFAALAAAARAGGPVKVTIHLSDAGRRMLHEIISRRLVNLDYGYPGRHGLARLAAQLQHELPAAPERRDRRTWGPGHERAF
jgi:hypothetical protein